MKLRAAAIALLAVVATILAAPANAEIRPKPGPAVPNDKPFHFARGDHLDIDEEFPTDSRYGRGRPIYLVGDSQAAQLADGLLRVAKKQDRALLPRTRAGTKMVLPARDTSAGRWSGRILAQIQAEQRRPIVVLVGWYQSIPRLRDTIEQLRDEADAKVLVVTSTPIAEERYNYCVLRAVRDGRAPNRVCRWRMEDRGKGSSESLTAARQADVPSLNLLPLVARGRGTHPPVVRSVMVHRNPSHITSTFARTVLYKPLLNAVRRAD